MYMGLHVTYSLFLSDFKETWIFSTGFSKNTQISHLMRIHPARAELLHVDRQGGMQTWKS